MNRQPRTHANSTVNRDQDGSIRYIVTRAEYYYEDIEADEHSDNKYTDGVNAKFRFSVSHADHGVVATLDSVKDISDGANSGYETDLQFLRVLPVAEDAVTNIPGIDAVKNTEEKILSELEEGRTAI